MNTLYCSFLRKLLLCSKKAQKYYNNNKNKSNVTTNCPIDLKFDRDSTFQFYVN